MEGQQLQASSHIPWWGEIMHVLTQLFRALELATIPSPTRAERGQEQADPSAAICQM